MHACISCWHLWYSTVIQRVGCCLRDGNSAWKAGFDSWPWKFKTPSRWSNYTAYYETGAVKPPTPPPIFIFLFNLSRVCRVQPHGQPKVFQNILTCDLPAIDFNSQKFLSISVCNFCSVLLCLQQFKSRQLLHGLHRALCQHSCQGVYSHGTAVTSSQGS